MSDLTPSRDSLIDFSIHHTTGNAGHGTGSIRFISRIRTDLNTMSFDRTPGDIATTRLTV
ncbi:MAG: hypothetical protein B7Z55_08500 [Planctomycetales bacterium 12-60-4]|nr:MAG: hypothetical protein B7Z55_08500 [Planctomycetales bacterium 12-60-4]